MPNNTEEMRAKAYALVAQAEADPEFARRAKADPVAVLREVGLPEDSLHTREQQLELPPWWGCNDFTCWTSACPATCYVTFCGTTFWLREAE
jgi:hypothetical protein